MWRAWFHGHTRLIIDCVDLSAGDERPDIFDRDLVDAFNCFNTVEGNVRGENDIRTSEESFILAECAQFLEPSGVALMAVFRRPCLGMENFHDLIYDHAGS